MVSTKTINQYEEEIAHYVIDGTNGAKITSQKVFQNDCPLHIEIGCGNGHFLMERCQNNLDINFIGIDISRKRVMKSALKMVKRDITNVRFLLGEGKSLLNELFIDHSVETFYLNFPDPWPKRKHHKNRIIRNDFIQLIFDKLKVSGYFYAASDHSEYFHEILNLFEGDERFINRFPNRYLNHLEGYEVSLYEEKWRTMKKEIYYLKFQKV